MNKKAYMHTIEVVLAVLLTFAVAYFIIPRTSTPQEAASLSILPVLEQKPEFRGCVISLNYSCVESYLRDYLPKNYDFDYDITENPETPHANLPAKSINTESIYIAGNSSVYSPKIVRLYYWRKG